MTYNEIVEKTRALISKADVSSMGGHLAIQVNITGEGEGAFYIEVKDGKVNVEPYEYNDRDCKFIVSADNFMKIASGSLDAVGAFMSGKLKIEGSVDKALEFKKIVDIVKNSK